MTDLVPDLALRTGALHLVSGVGVCGHAGGMGLVAGSTLHPPAPTCDHTSRHLQKRAGAASWLGI